MTRVRPARVGIDIDGVLANFVDAWRSLLHARTGYWIEMPPGGVPVWQFDQMIPKADRDAAWHHVYYDKTFWRDLAALPGTETALRRLEQLSQASRVEAYFITSREAQNVMEQTQDWLYIRGVVQPNVILAKGAEAKAAIAQALRLDYIIDDAPDNLEQFVLANQSRRFATGRIYAVEYPYNTHVDPDRHHINYVKDFGVFVGMLEKAPIFREER